MNSPNDNQYIADNRDEHEKLQPTATTSVVETACGYGDVGQQKHETANTASQRGNDVGEKLEPPKFRAASTTFKVGKLIEAHFDCFAEVHRLWLRLIAILWLLWLLIAVLWLSLIHISEPTRPY